MKLKKSLFGVVPVLAISVCMTGCGSNSGGSSSTGTTGSTTSSSGSGGHKALHLAFVTNNVSDYWGIAKVGVDKALKELNGDTVDFIEPQSGSAGEQKTIVENLLTKGVDGIAISPKDPTNQTELINKWAQQTLIVTQDSDAPNSKRTCYIGTDNEAAGEKLGEELKKALPNGGSAVAFVGDADAQNAHDRIDGIKKAIAGTKINIIDVRTDNADHQKAKSNVNDILVAHPEVTALIGIWSYNGPAIAAAVKEQGKVGKIKIVCFDQEAGTLAGVKDGTIFATVVQQPDVFGYNAVKQMDAYLNGNKSAFPANGQEIIDTKVLHQADIDGYEKSMNLTPGK
jgi:ribose transport system substrate-binding protein